MTLSEKRYLYRQWLEPAPLKRLSFREKQRMEEKRIHRMAIGLVLVTILVMWMVGSR